MRRRNSSLTLLSVARMRSRRVVLLTRNCPRLLRSQMKVKPRKLKVSGFPPGVRFVLEADDNVISIPHEDHVARGLVPSPARGPEVEHVMQVDVGEQR